MALTWHASPNRNAFASFKIDDAFPDINANFHNFWVDPFEPGRVWYVTRATATHTGTLAGAIPPTGIRVDSPPQANSMTFNVDGQCTQLTLGYVLDKQLAALSRCKKRKRRRPSAGAEDNPLWALKLLGTEKRVKLGFAASISSSQSDGCTFESEVPPLPASCK